MRCGGLLPLWDLNSGICVVKRPSVSPSHLNRTQLTPSSHCIPWHQKGRLLLSAMSTLKWAFSCPLCKQTCAHRTEPTGFTVLICLLAVGSLAFGTFLEVSGAFVVFCSLNLFPWLLLPSCIAELSCEVQTSPRGCDCPA